jgi:hypothetical protein
VLVAVIGLIFLAISINRPQEIEVESREIQNFLQASSYHTSSCLEAGSRYYDFQDLISECYENENRKCGGEDERDVCEAMEETAIYLLDNSWLVGEEAYYKGYDLDIYTETDIILELNKGNESVRIRENRILISARDKLYMRLKIFY